MIYGGDYWDIKKILPYQRNFNFINSERSTGKSYTTAGFTIDRFLKTQEQSMLLVRTVDEKSHGALRKWYEKVIAKEFPGLPITFTSDAMFYAPEKDKVTWKVICECRALSEAVKVKKQSFPNVKWMMMDEYMLEPKHFDLYVKGWEEPNLLLNIYHTVDREEDRVCMFLLGNNTAFYNPYHLHPAFQIPPVEPGEIWYSENVLFQRYEAPESLKKKKKQNKFLKMIEGTSYGRYAKNGEYIGDNENFVEERTNKSNYVFAIKCNSDSFGVWFDYTTNRVYISTKWNTCGGVCLSLDLIEDGRDIRVTKRHSLIKWLGKKYSEARVFYESMEVKLKAEDIIRKKVV